MESLPSGDAARITLARWVGDDGSWEVQLAEGILVAQSRTQWLLLTDRGQEAFSTEYWSPFDE